jgi:SAM-dependent methyltransferase
MSEPTVLPHNERMAASWAAAGREYEKFSEDLSDAVLHCIDRLAPKAGEKVLDVATGTGWGARQVARRGAKVHGIDFSEDLIEAGKQLAEEEGLEVELQTADAEALPFEDGTFDVVMSTFGVMFVQQPEAASNELSRVCRPGGRIGLTSWPPDCTIAKLVKEVFTPYRPPPPDPPPPSQFLWGLRERTQELLGETFDLKFEDGCSVLHAPSGEDIWALWAKSHGLTVKLLQNLGADRAEQLQADFISFHETFRAERGIAMPRNYLVTIGIRNRKAAKPHTY